MTEYHPPLREMRFVLDELAGMAELAGLPGYEEATPAPKPQDSSLKVPSP